MAVVLVEREQTESGISGANGRIAKEYIARGTNSYQAVYAAAVATAPASFEGLYRSDPDIRPVWVDEIQSAGEWEVTVPYVPFQVVPSQPGFQYFRLIMSAGTQHITQSRGTVGAWDKFGALTDPRGVWGGAINVRMENGQFSIEGVDIPSTSVGFEVGYVFSPGTITDAFLAGVVSLRDKFNNAPFYGFQAGEVRIASVTIEQRGVGNWDGTFQFACSPNGTNVQIGGTVTGTGSTTGGIITVTSKYGQDLLWVEYEKKENTSTYLPSIAPARAYVERVFDAGDFSLLGIGTSRP
jgi:hypothetical protein